MPPLSKLSRSCLALAISQAIIAPAHSANFVVDRSDDVVASDGSLSLREAIICARENMMFFDCPSAGDVTEDVITFNTP